MIHPAHIRLGFALLAATLAAGSAGQKAGQKAGKKGMIPNQKYLHEAQTHIDSFEATLDPDWALKAQETLDDVLWTTEPDSEVRKSTRLSTLDSWLRLFNAVERHIDRDFDETDVPPKLVSPPPFSDPNQGSLRPGADPSRIADPKLRAEYERAIAENRAKIKRYRLQLELRKLDQELRPTIHSFIASAYKPTPRAETKSGSQSSGMSATRRRKRPCSSCRSSQERTRATHPMQASPARIDNSRRHAVGVDSPEEARPPSIAASLMPQTCPIRPLRSF